MSPELQAQMEEGRKLARLDAREHPAEREPRRDHTPVQPAPKPAPTVTVRQPSRLRRALGALLGNGNKNEGS